MLTRMFPDQITKALATDNYWTVLGAYTHLRHEKLSEDNNLCHRVNYIKHLLQVNGPKNIPGLINNKGKSKGHIFHAHANDSKGKTYVMEWTVIDSDRKILAIVGFGIHENYPFIQQPLKDEEMKKILNEESKFDKKGKDKSNKRILKDVDTLRAEAKRVYFSR